MSSNYGFEPTLDGLNNIDSDSTTTNNIICNTLLVNTTANVPTPAPSSNDTSVATTAFVQNAVVGSFVTIGSTQTVTGEKTFSNANTYISGTLNTDSISGSVATATSNLYTGQTSGVLNIGTEASRTGRINIGNGATATNDIRIGSSRSGAGTIIIGSNNSSTNTVSIQSATIDIGTVSPGVTTNDVSIGNGQIGSTIVLNSETTCVDDLIVNNIKATTGSMTISTDPVGYTDDITISTANDLTLNAGFNAVINCYQGSFGATNFFGFTSNGSGGMSFNENFGGSVGMNFNGTKVSFNNSGLTSFAGSEVSIDGGQLTVNAGPFVIKSGGTERVSINYALGQTSIKIKTDGDAIRFTGSDNTLIMELGDTLAPLYKKGSITVPDTTNINIIPVGTILTTVTSTVPAGYLYCGGGLQSTSSSASNPYYELFLAIGYTYGGSGANFAIPDFKGMFLRGFGSQTAGGVTYQAGAVGAIQYDMALTTPVAGYSTPFVSTGFRSCGSGTRDCLARTSQGDTPENPTGLNLAYPTGRGGTEVRPVNRAVYYYIKY